MILLSLPPSLPTPRTLTAIAAVALVAVPASAAPDYPFSGRWRVDTASLNGAVKPQVFQVRDGYFSRDSANPIKADGRPHHVPSDDYVDEVTITIQGDHAVREVDRIRGKLAYTVDYRVSADGNVLTSQIANYTGPDGKPVTGETVQRRIGPAPKGGHLLSGTWKRVSMSVDAKDDWLLTLKGDRFSWRRESGAGYDAVIGGPPVKLDGDNAGIRAQVTRPRPDTIVETDLKTDDTVADTLSMQVMPDGKTITATGVYDSGKQTSVFTLNRVGD